MNMRAIHTSVDEVEEVAEDFLLGRLSSSDLQAYEEHLLICDLCRGAVETTDEFITVFREAVSGNRRGSRVA